MMDFAHRGRIDDVRVTWLVTRAYRISTIFFHVNRE